MGEDDDWQRLISALDAWTSAEEIAPGQIEVALPEDAAGRRVVVVMTPDQWDELAGVMWGSFDDGLEDVKRTLLELRAEDRFAVYSQYRLVAAADATPHTSAPPAPAPDGAWVAYDEQGQVSSRFSDWSEGD